MSLMFENCVNINSVKPEFIFFLLVSKFFSFTGMKFVLKNLDPHAVFNKVNYDATLLNNKTKNLFSTRMATFIIYLCTIYIYILTYYSVESDFVKDFLFSIAPCIK